jgi:hypothetical protein
VDFGLVILGLSEVAKTKQKKKGPMFGTAHAKLPTMPEVDKYYPPQIGHDF